jgi:hypothetical protein
VDLFLLIFFKDYATIHWVSSNLLMLTFPYVVWSQILRRGQSAKDPWPFITEALRKAADDISTAIEIFPEEMMFHSCRALLCRRLGRFEEAQNEYLTLRRLEAKVEKLNDGDKADNLKRQETIFVSSSLKKFSSSNISTSRSFHSANSTDLKAKLYGDLHQALTCRPGKRTKQQIDLLTEESRMMAAFSHFDTQQLSTLWQYFEYKNYPSNARIFEQGDEADDYFLVWSGSGKSLYIAPARIDVKQRCLQSLIQMTFS